MHEHNDIAERLDQLDIEVRQLVRQPVPDEYTADAMGRCRKIEVDLSKWRRGMLAETGPMEGEDYKVEVTRKATRSYAPAAIFSSVFDIDKNIDGQVALQMLLDAGAVRLTWAWSKLEQFMAKHNLELRTVGHEITDDGDPSGPHVGAVWKEDTRVVGMPPKEATE